MLDIIGDGITRSARFRALVDTITRSDGIVYVEFGYCHYGRVNGCLLPYLTQSGNERYLRVLVTPDPTRVNRDQRISIIAHELQHAIEVIEHPEVVDLGTMERLFRKIGRPLGDGMTGYETSEARLAGMKVQAELGEARPTLQTARLESQH